MITPRDAASRLRTLLHHLRSDGIVRNNAIFFVGNVGAGVFGYVYHFAVGRLLGPASYGVVASAVAALYLLTLPSLVLQLVSTRFTSVAVAHDDLRPVRPLLLRLTSINLVLGVTVAALLWSNGTVVAHYLQLTDRGVVTILGLSTLLGLVLATNRGVLQGMRRFAALSGNLVIDTVGRVVVAVGLVLLGLGPAGAILGVLAGPLVAYVQTFLLLRRLPSGGGQAAISFGQIARFATPAAAAVVGVTYLFNIDVLLAKHYLSPHDAGIYAAGAVLARVVYFLGLTIAAVMFPEVATLHARDQAHFHVVDLSLLFLSGVGAVLIAAYALLPGLVLLPYGSSFAPLRPYLGAFALALTLLALSNLLVNYFLSLDSRRFILPLLGACVLETLLIAAFHDGPGRILQMLVLANFALLTALGLLYLADRWRRQPVPAREKLTV